MSNLHDCDVDCEYTFYTCDFFELIESKPSNFDGYCSQKFSSHCCKNSVRVPSYAQDEGLDELSGRLTVNLLAVPVTGPSIFRPGYVVR